jgi:hypothetical protein
MNAWTEAEERIIAQIMASETMHDLENTTGDRRIACTRIEAVRRLQRRKVGDVYRAPSKPWVLASVTEPVTPPPSPKEAAALATARAARRQRGEVLV